MKNTYDQTRENDLWHFVTGKVWGYCRNRRNTKIV